MLVGSMGDENDSAGSPGVQKQRPNGHRSGTCSSDLRRLARLLLGRLGVHQKWAVVGYPDASLFVDASAIASGAGRGRDGPCGCLDSAWRLRAGRKFGLGANKRRCNSADHGRSGCKWLRRCGSGRKERASAVVDRFAWAVLPMREISVWTASHALWNTTRATSLSS